METLEVGSKSTLRHARISGLNYADCVSFIVIMKKNQPGTYLYMPGLIGNCLNREWFYRELSLATEVIH